MTRTYAFAPLLAAVALAPLTRAPADAKKCGQSENGPLIAIDGEIVEVEMEDIDRDRIRYVEVVCLDPADSTFNMRPGGIPVISVWTIDGPVARFEPILQEILELQRARHVENGAYLTSIDLASLEALADERGRAHGEAIELSVKVVEGGWVATASVPRFLGLGVVYDGPILPPHPSVAAGQPAILDRHSVQSGRQETLSERSSGGG